ncbi:MAG: polysulfide reductase NrfD [Gammaproteobacteria bacterium]|nr:polysulfide reductase NrfD [Gammaproteobacteria bacterium]
MIDAPASVWFTTHPNWGWLVVLYFFLGGFAGGCYVLAAAIDLFGRERDRPIARAAYFTVLPCLALSAIALILDLSRPDRFWHLLVEIHTWRPLFQWWTPINFAAWMMLAFGTIALLSALAAASEAGWLRSRRLLALRPPGVGGTVICVSGALLGLYIASYEGLLLAFTSRPVWSETPLIGPVLVLTAVAMAAAYLVLFGRWRAWDAPGIIALQRIDAQALAVGLLALAALVVSLGASARALLEWRNLLLIALVVVLGVAALVLHWRESRFGGAATAAALVLASGFLLRALIVFMPHGIER